MGHQFLDALKAISHCHIDLVCRGPWLLCGHGPYWQARGSSETDLYRFLEVMEVNVVVVEDGKGGSLVLDVALSRGKLERYSGVVAVISDIAFLCQMSAVLECRDGRIVSRRVSFDGCT